MEFCSAISGMKFYMLMTWMSFKNMGKARHRWLTSVILTTQEAEIRRIVVRSQPGQIVCKTLS
jgi:hypothetical protein